MTTTTSTLGHHRKDRTPMFNLKIDTHWHNLPGVDEDAGKAIADALRKVADDVEQRINIAPGSPAEWVPEHYQTAVGRQWVRWSLTAKG